MNPTWARWIHKANTQSTDADRAAVASSTEVYGVEFGGVFLIFLRERLDKFGFSLGPVFSANVILAGLTILIIDFEFLKQKNYFFSRLAHLFGRDQNLSEF